MSTSAVTLRWPQRSRRSIIQGGVFAFVSTFRTTRPEKRPHKSGASTFTFSLSSWAGWTGSNSGCLSAAPVSADNSRATPKTLKACARFGVSLSVKRVSSRLSTLRTSAPTSASGASSSKPPWSSLSLSSRAEHSMPWLSTPRSLPSLIWNGLPSSPGGSSAPTSAVGTRMPGRALGAPQTMLRRAPCPTSTWHTRRRSALGCWTASLISPTTTLVNGGATGRRSSTSSPPMVSVSAICCVVSGGLQNSRSQDSGNCMVLGVRGLAELAQEADVAVEEQAQVVHPVAQHREPVGPHAKREPDVLLGIEAHVAHDGRVHLARAGDLEPLARE